MRRYRRNTDPYQRQDKFVELLDTMKSAIYPKGISDQDFKKLLFAVQHAERHSAKVSKSGRKAFFDEDFLFNAALKLRSVLRNETGERISLLRFISTYLPIVDYPSDIRTALHEYKINIEEARILNRINRRNLGAVVKRGPSEIRRELIESHLKRQGTQAELKRRVNERLNLTPKGQVEHLAANIAVIEKNVDDLLEFNEFDTEHLLWEEIKGLVYLMREVESSLVDDETMDYVLKELDGIKLKLFKFRKTKSPAEALPISR